MFTIVELLAYSGHKCYYGVINYHSWSQKISETDLLYYQTSLENLGISVYKQNLDIELLNHKFDAIYFKYFYSAENIINHIRLLQPSARIIIDSVDIVYARLFAKAKLENNSDYYLEAEKIKKRELATYSKSDLVVTITPEDTDTLTKATPNVSTFIIPNIHEIHAFETEKTPFPSLIFIGVFSHEPNVDAVLYFYRNVWPTIVQDHPNCHWLIVGGSPPLEIQALAGSSISVTGYVPETLPYLKKSWISVAPLRFGAGMKGKVGEAMAAGIPVVTTDFGAQGLEIINGQHLIIVENDEDYATQINNLILDKEKRRYIGNQGLEFIKTNYSKEAVSIILNDFTKTIKNLPTHRFSAKSRLYIIYTKLSLWISRNITWRINKANP
ncbi:MULTISPECIES: glycosyltransferase [Methylomonas]|uniref:Glycosyltransferase n=2 Tax=Methylomonas TaxID=416 RepID=A0A126T8F7_9GAMM|nr:MULTISPECIES: glycosyltransferase [Methylomonas]AMK78375.1 hypothetical protein JT25_018085 [Methylomonas denitrificans]OAI04083.1 hypothetical protein A1342_06010 [Methylomonas methanica]